MAFAQATEQRAGDAMERRVSFACYHPDAKRYLLAHNYPAILEVRSACWNLHHEFLCMSFSHIMVHCA